MPLQFNIRHLEKKNLRLAGELPVADLDINPLDRMIRLTKPLRYDLEVQKLENSFLVQGELRLGLDCQCVRCLEAFQHEVVIPKWMRHLELQGEEPVAMVNELVDLTPYLREDILLEFPQHPLCKADCGGLAAADFGKAKDMAPAAQGEPGSSAWIELNKLKF